MRYSRQILFVMTISVFVLPMTNMYLSLLGVKIFVYICTHINYYYMKWSANSKLLHFITRNSIGSFYGFYSLCFFFTTNFTLLNATFKTFTQH